MIGVIYEPFGVSFRKCGFLTAKGITRLGYTENAVRLLPSTTLMVCGKFKASILIGDTIYTTSNQWHRYHAHFTEKLLFWCDSPIDFFKHLSDSEVDFLNDYTCVVAVSKYDYDRLRERGVKVYGIVGRPLDEEIILKVRESEDDKFKKLYGDYILTLGADQILAPPRHPRKGLDIFDKAIGMIKSELKKQGIKVIAITNWRLKNIDVRIPFGSLTEYDLLLLMKSSRLFVFPSRLEAFGMPPLEAMSVGTLVVYSNVPAHNEHCLGIPVETNYVPIHELSPEISKYWVVYDYDYKDLAKTILYALDISEQEREKMTREAMRLSEKYFSKNIASLLLEV